MYKNKFINEDWNSFNILSQNAATVGALDLNFFNKPNGSGSFFDKMNNHNFDLLYLVGSDELNSKKIMNLLFIKVVMEIEWLKSQM